MSAIKFSLSSSAASSKTASISKANKSINSSTSKLKSKSILNDEDEEENNISSSPKKLFSSSNSLSLLNQQKSQTKLNRQQKIKQEEALKIDSNVFAYDEVYDDMKSVEKEIKLEKIKNGAERKPQYISGLIQTAKQREIDRIRAEDKMVQRERETEGLEFADKDAFVTPAYLKQQEELKKAEEEERLKADKVTPSKDGMALFYKNILNENAKRHEATMEAVVKRKAKTNNSLGLAATLSASQTTSGTVTSYVQPPQYDPEPEIVPSDVKLAAEIEAKLGQKVDLDDEGKIIDHRQLLTGGLNLGPPKLIGPQKPKKAGFGLSIAERARQEREKAEAEAEERRKEEEKDLEDEEGLSQAEKLKLSRERQSRLLQQQLLELDNKKRRSEEETKIENAKKAARRNDDSKIEALRLKAIERRKAREQAHKESQEATLSAV
ncbi:hypothetical protein O181_072504 [Austropuccinia psidii MF-1]|uniref:Nuclear speckle splicing regulatory protein 1 N-terminal domain-containing protein n=1 Tax=Austropuccinia psidii MF-1 TaxID=1389203 RepID=A0A9Q3F5B5_9BASI|nr:hypothetical protein [Austropuccinia psidii MF-1]